MQCTYKTPEKSSTSEAVVVQDCFLCLDVDFTDRAILSMIRNLSRGGYVSVTYIARRLTMARETVSKRITKLENDGIVERLYYGKRRVQVLLTKYTLEKVKDWHLSRKIEDQLNRNHEKQKAENLDNYRRDMDAAFKVGTLGEPEQNEPDQTEQPQPLQAIQPNPQPQPQARTIKPVRDMLIERFSDRWHKTGLPYDQLLDSIDDYIDYCQMKGSMPSREGCRRRLESCATRSQMSQKIHQSVIRLSESKMQKNEALATRTDLQTDTLDNINFELHRARYSPERAEAVYDAA